MREITHKQRKFAEAILTGAGPSDAYRAAGYANTSSHLVSIQAQKVIKHPLVAAYIAKKRQELAAKADVTRQDKLRVLGEMINATDKPDPVRIKAVEVHNVMTGDNAPQEVNIFGLADLLAVVRKGKR